MREKKNEGIWLVYLYVLFLGAPLGSYLAISPIDRHLLHWSATEVMSAC